ncbi:MAG: hypothetical protein AAF266_14840 [Planctomycetota bacterium]
MKTYSTLLALVATLAIGDIAAAGVQTMSQSDGVNVTVIDEGQGRLRGDSTVTLDQSPTGATSIGRGTAFRSYLIKIDDFDNCEIDDYSASFEADEPIIGIQTDVGSLQDGRRTLDDNGFDAGAPAGGIEDNDSVTLDGQTVSVDGRVGRNGVDPIRVFVAAVAVPEAASIAVWGSLCLAGLVGTRRSRND